ncbi:hypothetical protein QL293_21655, partial [Bacillus subtilis]|uniref:hypothetical protein n=1 Tax=Bacillus subtilis TaxID=1423 RepID=UPI0024A7A91E
QLGRGLWESSIRRKTCSTGEHKRHAITSLHTLCRNNLLYMQKKLRRGGVTLLFLDQRGQLHVLFV